VEVLELLEAQLWDNPWVSSGVHSIGCVWKECSLSSTAALKHARQDMSHNTTKKVLQKGKGTPANGIGGGINSFHFIENNPLDRQRVIYMIQLIMPTFLLKNLSSRIGIINKRNKNWYALAFGSDIALGYSTASKYTSMRL
jgi:hypothetical protein